MPALPIYNISHPEAQQGLSIFKEMKLALRPYEELSNPSSYSRPTIYRQTCTISTIDREIVARKISHVKGKREIHMLLSNTTLDPTRHTVH